jgi:hypothetical protein
MNVVWRGLTLKRSQALSNECCMARTHLKEVPGPLQQRVPPLPVHRARAASRPVRQRRAEPGCGAGPGQTGGEPGDDRFRWPQGHVGPAAGPGCAKRAANDGNIRRRDLPEGDMDSAAAVTLRRAVQQRDVRTHGRRGHGLCCCKGIGERAVRGVARRQPWLIETCYCTKAWRVGSARHATRGLAGSRVCPTGKARPSKAYRCR